MLLKCCSKYVSTFGKLSSRHWTGKGQFSFQIQRQAMPKNVQITAQLLSSHMTVRLCSKSFKLGFSSTWTENFQMYKLGLEKADEPEIKSPTSGGSQKKQENSKKTSTSASVIMLKPLTVWITTNHGKFLDMGILDLLTCLQRILYAGQEATVRTRCETTDWLFQIGKGVDQGCILSPCSFNFYAEYIMWNASLDEAQAGIKVARRNINNLSYADDATLVAESEEELKSLLMRMKEESEKAAL